MRLTDLTVSPRPLALARVLLGLAAILTTLEVSLTLAAIARGELHMPTALPLPVPTVGIADLWFVVSALCGLLLTLGWHSGLAAGTWSALNLYPLALDQQLYSNHFFLFTLLVAFLAFARSGSAFSLDARLGRGSEAVPWWPQMLMLVQVSVLYLFAGLSKLNATWLDGSYLQGLLRIDLFGMEQTLALLVIVGEVAMSIALWIPATRKLALLGGVMLHVAIPVLMYQSLAFLSFSLGVLATYPLFVGRPPLQLLVSPTSDSASAASV